MRVAATNRTVSSARAYLLRKARDEKVAIGTGLLEEPTEMLTFLCDTEHGRDSKPVTSVMLISDSLARHDSVVDDVSTGMDSLGALIPAEHRSDQQTSMKAYDLLFMSVAGMLCANPYGTTYTFCVDAFGMN